MAQHSTRGGRCESARSGNTAHEWAVQHGSEVLHEPQPFPQYHQDYYAVFWTDPHDFMFEVLCVAQAET